MGAAGLPFASLRNLAELFWPPFLADAHVAQLREKPPESGHAVAVHEEVGRPKKFRKVPEARTPPSRCAKSVERALSAHIVSICLAALLQLQRSEMTLK